MTTADRDRSLLPVALLAGALAGGSGCGDDGPGQQPIDAGIDAAIYDHEPADGGPFVSARYVGTNEEFSNPERGLLQVVQLFDSGDIEYVRGLGVTVGNARVRLDDYRDGPIAASFLADLQTGIDQVREAGYKLVVRFQYDSGDGQDASLAQVLEHIEQLTPLLQDNADVIMVVQAGFIGAWGEWHSSSNELDNPADELTITDALLAALPVSRMIQIRTPDKKDAIYPGGPLDDASAFSGEPLARIGHHNDCFLGSESDRGTYEDPIDEWKAYVAADGRYTPVGGESCRANAPRTDCESAEAELRELHWSFINRSWKEDVVDSWKEQGCYERIQRNLGYRFALRWARWSEAVSAGDTLELEFCIDNVGYAAPFNERPVYAVIGTGADRVEVQLERVDARQWQGSERTVVTAQIPIPDSLAPGSYRLGLWLPDAYYSLRGEPEYSIRFANEQVWSASDGVNVLTDDLRVGAP